MKYILTHSDGSNHAEENNNHTASTASILHRLSPINYWEESCLEPSATQLEEQIQKLLQAKHLSLDVFHPAFMEHMTVENDISQHAAWVFRHIYSVPYKNQRTSSLTHGPIARLIHGIQHVSRTALYIPVFTNLFRKYGHPEALVLTSEDVKLLQIAALFHDSAREGEEEDRWDHESSLFLLCYLLRLKVPFYKAKLLVEAAANKDVRPHGYFQIIVNLQNQIACQWNETIDSEDKKNIYQKIIHDADCLDIIRACPHFDATYLDFYKDLVAPDLSPIGTSQALEDMAHLIMEARSLIEMQGDSYRRIRLAVKQNYEIEGAYTRILDDLHPRRHAILCHMHTGLIAESDLQLPRTRISTFYPQTDSNEGDTQSLLHEGRLLARSIFTPSARHAKHPDKSLADIEIEKTARTFGIPTSSLETTKEGNPLRSVSLIGYGAAVFACAGLLIRDYNFTAVKDVSSVDFGSGTAKKSLLAPLNCETELTKEHMRHKMQDLHQRLKLGGSSVTFNFRSMEVVANHVEILYHLTSYDGIYYSNDPNFTNPSRLLGYPTHECSPFLQAVYLQKVYAKYYDQIKDAYCTYLGEEGEQRFYERFGDHKYLPLYEYSGIHNELRVADASEYSDDSLVVRWAAMCAAFMRERLTQAPLEVFSMSLEDIKVLSMYDAKYNPIAKENAPADVIYSENLQERVNDAIERERADIKNEYQRSLLSKLHQGELSILSTPVCIQLCQDPAFFAAIEPSLIEKEVLKEVNSVTLFDACNATRPGFPFLEYCLSMPPVVFHPDALSEMSDMEKELLFKHKLVKVYTLTKKLGKEEEAQEIRAHAVQKAREFLEKPVSGSVSRKLEHLLHAIRYTQILDCYEELAEMIQYEVHHVVCSVKVQCDADYMWLIEQLLIHGLLDENTRAQALEVLSTQKVSNSNQQLGVKDIFYFIKLSRLLQQGFQADLFVWLGCQARIGRYDFRWVEAIFENEPITPNDSALFEELIRILTPSSSLKRMDLLNWLTGIKSVRQMVSNHLFTKDQKKLINQNLLRLSESRALALCNENISVVIEELYNVSIKLLELNFKLEQLNPLVQQFNQKLCDMAAHEIEPLLITKMTWLHEKLPAKEEREYAMNSILSSLNSQTENAESLHP